MILRITLDVMNNVAFHLNHKAINHMEKEKYLHDVVQTCASYTRCQNSVLLNEFSAILYILYSQFSQWILPFY